MYQKQPNSQNKSSIISVPISQYVSKDLAEINSISISSLSFKSDRQELLKIVLASEVFDLIGKKVNLEPVSNECAYSILTQDRHSDINLQKKNAQSFLENITNGYLFAGSFLNESDKIEGIIVHCSYGASGTSAAQINILTSTGSARSYGLNLSLAKNHVKSFSQSLVDTGSLVLDYLRLKETIKDYHVEKPTGSLTEIKFRNKNLEEVYRDLQLINYFKYFADEAEEILPECIEDFQIVSDLLAIRADSELHTIYKNNRAGFSTFLKAILPDMIDCFDTQKEKVVLNKISNKLSYYTVSAFARIGILDSQFIINQIDELSYISGLGKSIKILAVLMNYPNLPAAGFIGKNLD